MNKNCCFRFDRFPAESLGAENWNENFGAALVHLFSFLFLSFSLSISTSSAW